MLSPTLQKLVDLFAKFPTVGPRTARRFAFYLVNAPEKERENLVAAIKDLKTKIKMCKGCDKIFEASEQDGEFCAICSDPRRDKTIICLVEKETDLEAIEKTGQYKGLYFILSETISKNNSRNNSLETNVEKLCDRIKIQYSENQTNNQVNNQQTKIQEIILAFNPTLEGRQLALKLQRHLEPLKVKITHLGLGLPVGGEIEYADEETITSALDNRR